MSDLLGRTNVNAPVLRFRLVRRPYPLRWVPIPYDLDQRRASCVLALLIRGKQDASNVILNYLKIRRVVRVYIMSANNKWLLIDEGQEKYIPESIMKGGYAVGDKHYEYLHEACYFKNKDEKLLNTIDIASGEVKTQWIHNPDYKKATGYIKHMIDMFTCNVTGIYMGGVFTSKQKFEKQFLKQMATYDLTMEDINSYLDIVPLVPHVMINISPVWTENMRNHKIMNHDKLKRAFILIVTKYFNDANRYSSWKGVLETGSEDNFLHCHVVAECNKDCLKSVYQNYNKHTGKDTSHIGKGNQCLELRKLWDKHFRDIMEGWSAPEGYVGLLKGKYSIQTIRLNNKELIRDKFAYLTEEGKSEGHKNLVPENSVSFGSYCTTSKELPI